MPFMPRIIDKFLDLVNLQRHNDNYSDIKSELDIHDAHLVDTANPHAVTKAQVGLGSVDNVQQATKAEFTAHVADYAKDVAKVFNVVGYGALPSLGDNTAAINAAIAAAAANGGGIVYIPPGTFTITGAITPITKNGIYIKGSGQFATILKPTSDTANFLTVGDEALGTAGVVKGVGISDLSIQHNSTRSAGYTIKAVNAQHVYFKDLYISNAFTMFQLGSATDTNSIWTVIEDVIGNCTGSGIGVNILGGSNGIHLINLQINNENLGTALNITTGTNGMDTLYMDNCLFQRFAYGILATGSSGTVQNAYFTNCIFDGIDNGSLVISPTATGVVTRFHFSNCWFTSDLNDAVVISAANAGNTDGIYFSQCRWITVKNRGVVINSGNAINLKFSDCIISNCSTAGSGLYPAVQTAAGCKKFYFTGCVIGNEGKTTTNQSYAFFLGADNDLYEIVNCVLLENVTGAISDAGGTTFTKKLIKDNLGYNPTGNVAAPSVPASTVVQKNNFSFPVQVMIYGGTVTGIAKNGVNISGMTNGSPTLSPGETITLTYSVVPVWTWFGI
jgi:hypothetical protein